MRPPKDLRVDLTLLIEQLRIIGGWSAILHGSSNVTNDLDVCYSRLPENLTQFA